MCPAAHTVGGSAVGEVLDARLLADGRHFRVEIVFAKENAGQFPQRRHIQGLVKYALVGGAVTEEGDGHPLVL